MKWMKEKGCLSFVDERENWRIQPLHNLIFKQQQQVLEEEILLDMSSLFFREMRVKRRRRRKKLSDERDSTNDIAIDVHLDKNERKGSINS